MHFKKRPDLTQIRHFSPPVPIAAPPTQPNVAGPSAPQSTPSARQVTPILRKEKRIIQVINKSDSDTSSVRRSERHLKKQKKNFQPQYIVQKIQNKDILQSFQFQIPPSSAWHSQQTQMKDRV